MKTSTANIVGLAAKTLPLVAALAKAQYSATYDPANLPATTEQGQTGTNKCGAGSSQTSNCQNVYINSVHDFCLWAPPTVGEIGQTEEVEVAWCTQSGYGTRLIPPGTLTGVHFLKTDDYVQVTGNGDFTKMNIARGDAGGELDPHGATGNGNPIGGLVFSNAFDGGYQQIFEWTNFMSESDFCVRACIGPNAATNCQHIYDTMGCQCMPGPYTDGVFEQCDADDDLPMGLYGTSRWYQGVSPTPSAHPAASSSNCNTYSGISSGLGAAAPTAGSEANHPQSVGSGSSASSSSSASSQSTQSTISSSSSFSTTHIITVTAVHTSDGSLPSSRPAATSTGGSKATSGSNSASSLPVGVLTSFALGAVGAVAALIL